MRKISRIRIASCASWTIFPFGMAWMVTFSRVVGPPRALVDLAFRVARVVPAWLPYSGFLWYELLCISVLALWIGPRDARPHGPLIKAAFWIAVLNPFLPLIAITVQPISRG